MDNEQRVREMERASVERWFAPSPLGALFDAGDGRMLQIGVDAIEAARAEAFAIIDRFIVDSRPPPRWAVFGVIFAFTCALLALQPLLGLGGAAIGGIVMGGLILWHADDLLRLLRYRRDLKSLRARTAVALGARAPLPEDLAARYRRRNPWRTVFHIWVSGASVLALLSAHFVAPDSIGIETFPLALGAVAIGWLLYWLARRVDRAQAAATLASRATPPISPAEPKQESAGGRIRL